MRILHIIGTLDPRSGGPASAVANLIELSPSDSYNEVVTLDDPAEPYLQGREFPVSGLGPTRTKYGYNRRLSAWLSANADRFDGVVVHGLWQFCGLAAWRAFIGRKPYVVFVHGMLDPYFKRVFPLKHLKKWLYWLLVEYWVLRGAKHVLFTCAAEERLARESFWLHRWHSHILPFGTSVPAGDPAQRQGAFLSRFPALSGRRYLLYLGRIDRKKGCDLLVNAFAATAALDPDLDLVMAGPNERHWRAELERSLARAGISHRVHWTGMLQGDEKWGAFLASEAFILPSHQENFGIAVVEALACGRPVLLSDKINIAHDIAAAGAGLVEPDTLAGTRRLIEDWFALSPEHRSNMADNATQCFDLNYNLQTNTRHLGSLFDLAPRPGLAAVVPSVSIVK